MRPHASVWSMESFFVRFFVPAAGRASVVTVLFIPVRVQGHQEGLADHQQHRHHEGRSQGVLVRPHRRVPVLVQRRRGEPPPPPPCQRFTFKVRHRDRNIVHDSMNFLLSCGDFFFSPIKKNQKGYFRGIREAGGFLQLFPDLIQRHFRCFLSTF